MSRGYTAQLGDAMPRVMVWTRSVPVLWLFAALALIPMAAKLGAEGYMLSLATRALIFAIAALSLDLILGHGGLVSFGHAAFLGIGSYAVGMLAAHGFHELLAQLAVAALVAALFAGVTSAISLRTTGVYYIMSTLAFGQMLYFLAVSLSAYGGDDGITLPARSRLLGTSVLRNDVTFFYFALATLGGFYVLAQRVLASRFGRVLGAARENPVRVRAVGLEPFAFQLTACVLSGVMCATAGVLLANQVEFVSPAYMTWQRSGELIVMVVLGGMGTLWGAIIGAIGFLLLEEVLSSLTEQWKLILGPALILVALAGRGGIAGVLARLSGRTVRGVS